MKNLIIILALCVTSSLIAQEAPIERCDCPFDKSKLEAEEIWCGKLTVPENHKQPNERDIKLFFTVIKPKNATNDPVVLLPGGPGIAPVRSSYVGTIKKWIPENRTFVVFDPRGTGLSGPEMCPELNETYASIAALDLTFEEAQKMRLGADIHCRDRLVRAGIDLTQYSNDAIANDVNKLMTALGYQKYNLLGGSAGVPMIRSIMRLFPDKIRSAVLTNGPEIDLTHWFTFDVPNVEYSFNNMIKLCESDPQCNSRYPDLKDSFFRAYRSLKENPITVPVNQEDVMHPTFTLNTQDFIVILDKMLFREPRARHLPAIIKAVEDRDIRVITKLVEDQYGGLDSDLNIGMGNSVQCNGTYTPEAYAKWEVQALKSPEPFRELNYWLLPCDNWVKTYDPDETRKPFKSDIPSLIMQGEFDDTPDLWQTKSHIPYFSNLQYIIFPGMAHGPPSPRESPCWINLTKQFIENPNMKVNSDCLTDIPAVTLSTELPDWLKEN